MQTCVFLLCEYGDKSIWMNEPSQLPRFLPSFIHFKKAVYLREAWKMDVCLRAPTKSLRRLTTNASRVNSCHEYEQRKSQKCEIVEHPNFHC